MEFVYWDEFSFDESLSTEQAMAKLDFALTIIFGALALTSLITAILCFRQALKVSGDRDGDFKMFLWAVGSLMGLILGGMSTAYILLPILFTYTN